MVTVTAVIIGGRRYFLTLQKIWHNGKKSDSLQQEAIRFLFIGGIFCATQKITYPCKT